MSKPTNYRKMVVAKVAGTYIVLQLLCVPIMLAAGYDYSALPEGGHAVMATIIQILIALIAINQLFPSLFGDNNDI